MVRLKIDPIIWKDQNFREVHSINRAFETVVTVNYEDSKSWMGKSFDYDSDFVETEEFKRGDNTELRLYESSDVEDRLYFFYSKVTK